MHKDFADWYRAATVAPPGDLLQARWDGVVSAVEQLSAETLVTVLTLYALRPEPTYKAPEWFDKAFRDADSSFAHRDNIEELRALSGAILHHAIDQDSPVSIAAALGVIAASFGSRRANLTTTEHLDAALQYVARKGAAIREIRAAPVVRSAVMTKEKYEELMPAAAFAAPTTIRDPLEKAFAEHVRKINENATSLSNNLWRVIQTQREELNMLWWLQTGFSRDLNEPFHQISSDQASIIFPMELADLSVFIPGPTAATGMLITALSKTKGGLANSTVAATVNSLPRPWREQRASRLDFSLNEGVLCPVLLAMKKSLDTDGASEWFPVYRKACDVGIEDAVEQTAIGLQVYTERQFLTALSGIKK